jgi:hypothetical protein
MFDPTTLTNVVFLAISIAAMAAILRGIGAGDPVDLASMFAHPWEAGWPRGVQEEEPQPWRLERLGDAAAPAPPVALARSAATSCDDAWDAAA